MALVARDGHMFAFQRVLCCRMVLYGKRGRRKAFHVVACCTFTAIRAISELPLVGVLVTIHAFCEWDGSFKITMLMAVRAFDFRMFAEQWKFCFRVIKSL
jgi:hypothetical protein